MRCPRVFAIPDRRNRPTFLFGLILACCFATPVRAAMDMTDSSLPHAADSVLFDWYFWYDPSNMSNNLVGLEGAAWHSGDERTKELFPHWVQIDYGAPRTVVSLNLLAYSESDAARSRLKDFRFEGSDDGINFSPVHPGVLQYANRHEWQSFVSPDGPTYRFFRLYGLNNWGCHGSLCNQMIIEEWEMFGPPTGACCFPTGECLTETPETCTAAGGTYVGDDVPCEPDPCEPTPVNRATWGCLKSKFAPSDR